MNDRKLLFQNPATLLFLGAVPALGASADLRAAFGMSAAVLGVLLLSALILGLLRNLIPSEAKLPAALRVVAGCASAAQLLLHAFLPAAWQMLGFYAAVLAVDLMLFASAEDALDFPLGKSLCSALISGLIFAVFVLLFAAIRELFGAASICGNPIEALAPYKITLLTKTTGGLFVFAILLAVVNRLFPAQAAAGSLSRAAAGLSDGKEA